METFRQDDGMGGYFSGWTRGVEFNGLLSIDSSVSALVAEKQAEVIRAHLQVSSALPVKLGDYIERLGRNAFYRIESDTTEQATPADSKGLSFKEFAVVRVPELPR